MSEHQYPCRDIETGMKFQLHQLVVIMYGEIIIKTSRTGGNVELGKGKHSLSNSPKVYDLPGDHIIDPGSLTIHGYL
jgi:hypothetical protein